MVTFLLNTYILLNVILKKQHHEKFRFQDNRTKKKLKNQF